MRRQDVLTFARHRNIAKHANLTVLTSTRSESKVKLLESLGASSVLIENGNLSSAVRERYPNGIDSVLDLIGNSTMLDSIFFPLKRSSFPPGTRGGLEWK